MKKIFVLLSLCFIVSGCSLIVDQKPEEGMKLKKMGSDIPPKVLAEYERSKSDFVDSKEGHFLIFLLQINKQMTRQADGYEGLYNGSLGLIIYDEDVYYYYNKSGELISFYNNSSLLFGSILNRDTYWSQKKGVKKSRSILFGSFGYEKDYDGNEVYRALWMPLFKFPAKQTKTVVKK